MNSCSLLFSSEEEPLDAFRALCYNRQLLLFFSIKLTNQRAQGLIMKDGKQSHFTKALWHKFACQRRQSKAAKCCRISGTPSHDFFCGWELWLVYILHNSFKSHVL